LKTCRRSSSRISPFLANGLISRIVTTWESMSEIVGAVVSSDPALKAKLCSRTGKADLSWVV
jgi:hypothetical protein